MNNEIYNFLIEFYKGLGEIYIREHEKGTECNNFIYNPRMCCGLHLGFIRQFHNYRINDVGRLLHHSLSIIKKNHSRQTDELAAFQHLCSLYTSLALDLPITE